MENIIKYSGFNFEIKVKYRLYKADLPSDHISDTNGNCKVLRCGGKTCNKYCGIIDMLNSIYINKQKMKLSIDLNIQKGSVVVQ